MNRKVELSGNNKIAKNTLFLFIRTAFVLAISLYTSRVILQVLGVVDYGIYNVVGGFVAMFSFLNSALASGVQRFYNFELGKNGESGVQKVYICATIIQFVLIAVIVLLLETIGLWYINNKMVIPIERIETAKILFHFSTISLALVILGIPYSAAIMAYERMNYFAIVGIIDAVLKLVIVIILPYIKYDQLIIYGFLTLCITIFNFFLYFVYSKINFKAIKFSFSLDKIMLRSMLGFSGWHIFGTIAQIMRTQGINIVLNLFFGPVVNAARGITYQIQSALMSFVGNITAAARPQLVQSYAIGNYSRTINLMYSIGKICFYALLSMVIPICFEIDYVLNLWLGEKAVPNHTNIFTILVLIIALIDILNTPLSMVVHAIGKMKKYQIITSCISLFVLPLGYIVFELGTPASTIFIISIITSIFVQTASLFIVRELIGISLKEYFSKVIIPIIKVVLLSLIIPLLIRIFMVDGILRLVIISILSISSVLVTAFYFGLEKNEKELVVKMKKNLFSKLKIKRNE